MVDLATTLEVTSRNRWTRGQNEQDQQAAESSIRRRPAVLQPAAPHCLEDHRRRPFRSWHRHKQRGCSRQRPPQETLTKPSPSSSRVELVSLSTSPMQRGVRHVAARRRPARQQSSKAAQQAQLQQEHAGTVVETLPEHWGAIQNLGKQCEPQGKLELERSYADMQGKPNAYRRRRRPPLSCRGSQQQIRAAPRCTPPCWRRRLRRRSRRTFLETQSVNVRAASAIAMRTPTIVQDMGRGPRRGHAMP